MEESIKGELIKLRPSTMHDRRPIFEWLTNSDLTPFMLGLPDYPHNPVPTWDEFINDYKEYYFDGSKPELGRCFIIEVNSNSIGQVNYNDIYDAGKSTELDIWLSNSQYTNKGYGTDALNTLCGYLNKKFGCKKFIIAPSKRNVGAVQSYRKAGFTEALAIPANFSPDYDDTVVMVKEL